MKRFRFALITLLAIMMSGCATVAPDLGEADPIALPTLPVALAKEAAPLPPSSARTASELILEGLEDDRRYLELADRYDTLLSIYQCVSETLAKRDADDLEQCLD